MSDTAYVTPDDLKLWFTEPESEEFDVDIELSDLPYEGVEGYVLKLPHVTDYQVSVVFMNTDRAYDSYGNSYLNDGYVILAVTGLDGSSKNFKLPYSYASFEGWSWDVNQITEAHYREKIITTWEWENN